MSAAYQRNHQRDSACVIHCRVSTQKQAYEGESLDVQESICTGIAKNNGWTIAHAPWKESFSGRKNRRPVFDEVLAFLETLCKNLLCFPACLIRSLPCAVTYGRNARAPGRDTTAGPITQIDFAPPVIEITACPTQEGYELGT